MDTDERPAILQGTKAFPEPPGLPTPVRADIREAIEQALCDGTWNAYLGPQLRDFEAELGQYFGSAHVLTCASGTLAVEAALRACGVGPGDEVVMASYEYEANFLTIHAIGARPVLVDNHPRTGSLDPARLEAALTPPVKAILCSHLHGGLVAMRAVREIADRHGLSVIEDAAQTPGAIVDGRRAGTWGDVGTLSFGGSKLLSAGRGGALLFSEARRFQRARLWLSRGVQQWAPLSEIQAISLGPQLRRLDADCNNRVEQVTQITQELESQGVRGLTLFAQPQKPDRADYYKIGFFFSESDFGLTRERFLQAVRAEGLPFDEGFRALHIGRSQSRFRTVDALPVATRLHKECVKLHHSLLDDSPPDTAVRIARAIAKVYRNADRIRTQSALQ